MATVNFFDESREQSQIKAEIVAKYFWAWASVIIPTAKKRSNRIAYLDLFAGPGRYKDGTKSTPLLILEQALKHPDLPDMLVTNFNDMDSDHTRSLEKAIADIPEISRFKYPPHVHNEEVGTEIVKMFEGMNVIPTLFFVDPWGYKGLSLRLVNSILKDWGCDCIFFLNYNRINMGIRNSKVIAHMNALFGEERAEVLRGKLEAISKYDREMTIVTELSMALKDMGGKYVLPFCFKNERGQRTSHHLFFVTKHVKGYEIMKEIMAKYSSDKPQGVPSFIYSPVTSKSYQLLFDLSRPLDELGDMLLEHFAGRKISMIEIYNEHHVDRPFIRKNYKEILSKLEENGNILASPSADKRRRGTFADSVQVKFAKAKR